MNRKEYLEIVTPFTRPYSRWRWLKNALLHRRYGTCGCGNTLYNSQNDGVALKMGAAFLICDICYEENRDKIDVHNEEMWNHMGIYNCTCGVCGKKSRVNLGTNEYHDPPKPEWEESAQKYLCPNCELDQAYLEGNTISEKEKKAREERHKKSKELFEVFNAQSKLRILRVISLEEEKIDVSTIAQKSEVRFSTTRFDLNIFERLGIVKKQIIGYKSFYRFEENERVKAIKQLFEVW
jgi:DNA-binding transcriptional ArsR family regulator